MTLRTAVRSLTLIAALAVPLCAIAQPRDALDEPLVLVAQPSVRQFYAGTVLFVRPMGNGAHIGFIINRPTEVTLGGLFPEHAPSQKISKPLLFGGPEMTNMVFAIVQKASNPGGGSIAFAPNLYVAFDVQVVDQIIEREGNAARFVVGMVLWRPGELTQEVRKGFWFVRAPDAGLLFSKKTDGLWEELVAKSRSFV